MTLQLMTDDIDLLDILLTKEESDIEVEIHHSSDADYKKSLLKIEEQIESLKTRLHSVTRPVYPTPYLYGWALM